MRTSFRVLYDDEAVCFGAMMEDTGRPTVLLTRRDSFVTTRLGAAFTAPPASTIAR